MAKKRAADKPAVPEVPPATYDDADSMIPVGSEPVMPSVPEPIVETAPVDPAVPHLEWFRTLNPGKVFVEGSVCHLAVGSLVSQATHDLDALRSSGVALEPCERLQRPLDAYGEPL